MNQNELTTSRKRYLDRSEVVVNKYARGILKSMALGNTRLEEFFKGFEISATEVAREKIQEYIKKVEKLAENLSDMAEHKNELEKHLKRLGVKTSVSMPCTIELMSYRQEGKKIKHSFEVFQEFNGVRIPKTALTDEGYQKIKKGYEVMLEHDKNNKKQEVVLRKELKKLELRLKITFRGKQKQEINDEIAFIEGQLHDFSILNKEIEKSGKLLAVLDGMSPEQKMAVKKYLEFTDKMNEEIQKIDTIRKKAGGIKNSKYNEEITREAFIRYINSIGMTEEELISFFDVIRDVEERTDMGAFSTSVVTKKDSEVSKYQGAAIGFLKHIYEHGVLARNQSMVTKRKPKEAVQPSEEGHGEEGK